MSTELYGGMRLEIMPGRKKAGNAGSRGIVSYAPQDTPGVRVVWLWRQPLPSCLQTNDGRLSPHPPRLQTGDGRLRKGVRRGGSRTARGDGGNFPRLRQAAFAVFASRLPKKGETDQKHKRTLEPTATHAGNAHTRKSKGCRASQVLPRGCRGARSP